MRSKAVLRIRIITSIVLLLASVLLVRLYFVQVVQGATYKERGENQYVHTVQDLFQRGSIYFTALDGEPVSAARVQTGYLLALNPQEITDIDGTYHQLKQFLELDEEDFRSAAEKKERTYIEIEDQVENEVADAIDEVDITGVYLYRNQWRYYPGGALAAHTIGFIGFDGDELVGRYGLERSYEDVLRREDERLTVNFFAEIFTNLGNLVEDEGPSSKVGDIYTSIEPTVAQKLELVMSETNEEWDSTRTGGIIINPRTGDIYALGVVPAFDLNDRTGVAISDFQNPLVENVYELGSIIKALTIASGLDAGVITPESTYYDAGFLDLNDFTIKNYDGRGRGYVNMQEVLNQSLNTGVAHVVTEMGKEEFRDYFINLKLGSETGIDVPGEVHGLVNNLDSPRDVEYATASFGQGIALTPIAAVRALSALANGGVLVTPHLVQEVRYENGKVQEVNYPAGQQVFSAETSETISRMLVKVVDDALLGGTVAKEHYTIAAKTGTAQIADSENGGYYEDRFLHSFFGYFPAYEPEFLIFLYTVEPKGVRYASQTLTDPFMEMTDFLINYYDIPPDR